jgi:hypothetical protein
MYTYLLFTLVGIAQCAPADGIEISKRWDNGVEKTPAMGLNNWNAGLRK